MPVTNIEGTPLDPFDLPHPSDSPVGPFAQLPTVPAPPGISIAPLGNFNLPTDPGLYTTVLPVSDFTARHQSVPAGRVSDVEFVSGFMPDRSIIAATITAFTFLKDKVAGKALAKKLAGNAVWNSSSESFTASFSASRTADVRASLSDGRSAVRVIDVNAQARVQGPINKNKLIESVDSHAYATSQGRCAQNCRLALEAAGIDTRGHPVDAKDYGPFLKNRGAVQVVLDDTYQPQRGDIVVFAGNPKHPHGHIAIYNGTQWVSDFKQLHFSPYAANSTPPSSIYRFND